MISGCFEEMADHKSFTIATKKVHGPELNTLPTR